MNHPKHISLLIKLSNSGIGVATDISHVLIEEYPKGTDSKSWRWNREWRPVPFLLKDLFFREFIGFDERNILDEEEKNQSVPTESLFYQERIHCVYITSKGMDYLDSYFTSLENKELSESNKELNRVSIKSYTTQLAFSAATIVIAIVAAMFSALDYFKQDPEMAELNKNMRAMSKELTGIKQQLKTQTTLQPSRLEKSHKPQPSVSNTSRTTYHKK